jgi:hypothetical protein
MIPNETHTKKVQKASSWVQKWGPTPCERRYWRFQVGGVQIKHFFRFFIDIMSALFLNAGSSGDLRFILQKNLCGVIGLKWGVFCHFWGSKLRLINLSIFDETFLQEVKDLSLEGFSKKLLVPMDKQFWNCGPFRQPKRGKFAVFLVKIQTQLFRQLWWDFFYFIWKNYFFEVKEKKFQP